MKDQFDFGSKFKKQVRRVNDVKVFEGTEKSAEGTTHSVRNEEQIAFSNWINK